jgi:hypothetical protein
MLNHSVPVPREVVRSLEANKQVHWVFPKNGGLNESDYESDSKESTGYDSLGSESDPESEFY